MSEYARPEENTLGIILGRRNRSGVPAGSTAGRAMRQASARGASLGTGYLGIGATALAGLQGLYGIGLFVLHLQDYPHVLPVAAAWVIYAIAVVAVAVAISTWGERMPNWMFGAYLLSLAAVVGLDLVAIWPLHDVGTFATASISAGFGLLAGLVLIPVYAFYFLLEKRDIETRWKDYLPLQDSRAKDEVVFVLDSIKQYLVAFFRGQVLVAMCDAVLYTIGFLIVGVNYAFLLGFAAVLLTMIPFLGAIVICVTALTLAFVQYGDWQHPALVLAVFAVVQSLEGLVISPKIMGDRVGLHPLVIIIAVMAGTTLLGGILGGILAIPLAAALRVIMFRYVWKKRDV